MGEIEEITDEITKNFKNFKNFDLVRDPSDHHFIKQSNNLFIKPQTKAVKAITREYKILQQHLPSNSIFVRAYEDHIDLMRAVIVGPQGTPYSDALFFFDILFPQDYPSSPPKLYFHSHGLHFNPNLYTNGTVCLSLLNTWYGRDGNESWIPEKSTMLQVLLSIQALVLNEQPYFNEPSLWRRLFNPAKKSLEYNDYVFRLCCTSMPHVMRNPPRHFEFFVLGYFRENAYKILMNCGEYMKKYEVDLVDVMRVLINRFEENGAHCKHLYYLVDEAMEEKKSRIGGEKAIAQSDGSIKKWWKKLVNGLKLSDLFC